MKQIVPFLILLLVLISFFYYGNMALPESDTVFLTISTFLFAILGGFSISRQSARHESIRQGIAQFDGHISSLYRASMSFGEELQNEVGRIARKHYEIILETRSWDYHFTHKSDTITSIHTAMREQLADKSVDDLGKAVLVQAEWSLRDIQRARKDLVSLYQERIPVFQWLLLYLLAGILIATIFAIPSHTMLFPSLLKASFSLSIIVVLYLLHRLNSVSLFEGTIGESSAQDVLAILKGDR